ncbi:MULTISPECIES: LacI family DNA-binding transcriptional regulator [unclassified Streptomyces]|uniref:LacI family DNA-binding transcriptional regulator n=1 Tax=unclassified Streptomyces TaxID=2593676 RepID=UPI0022533611|nr:MULTISPECIES: LacI family DNA-binding transcriptional regulator [unclassified Streptomyces]WSP56945.1 LacI family transcriptional regulator [Streptomyces sp. NBC_01241]WSU22338.1 LacI family transcriptional regulator [Streptomyces sp. NBC_01108]MCX4788731.1 LacI family transcriptional regulator [Streptomyces sp. NBC_01221]MCX4795521.1 LacI family transcriptional regulator [Streptomyces sp. NBC_01242]WSJ36811.1 LacI family transcriptional regulator [Streptomyces sp. NBC_01321]
MSGPTLADVARAAEVSTATVSHALNGTGRLTESTRRRVCEVATMLGYRSQRTPRTGKTLGVAVTTYAGSVWNFLEVPYFARFLTAATATAHAHDYALTILPAARGAETPWHTLTVDGMLLLDSPTDDPVLRALRARGIPLVFDGRPVDPRPGDVWVDNDHTATTREVLGHLAASGGRRIALHAGYGDEHYTRAVTRAYEQWCHEHGRTPLLLTFDPYDDPGHGFDAVFAAHACDAVYTVYDRGGRQVLAAAARHGLRIPDDLLLVCASEDPAYAENDPPVSTVTLHPATIAETAVTALVSRLTPAAPPPPPGALTVPAVLHPRRSSRSRARPGCTRPGGR